MREHTIVTISRQYGSGGREVAEILAKKMQVRCYDRQIVYLAAEKIGNGDLDVESILETGKNKEDAQDCGERNLIRIDLDTGRHHQIRVQMAHAGMPLVGDRKYNPGQNSQEPLALCSAKLGFQHPVTKKQLEFQVQPAGMAFKRH